MGRSTCFGNRKGFWSYYRSLIPKWVGANGLRYAPHVTIVRTGKEVPAIKEHWGNIKVKSFHSFMIQSFKMEKFTFG